MSIISEMLRLAEARKVKMVDVDDVGDALESFRRSHFKHYTGRIGHMSDLGRHAFGFWDSNVEPIPVKDARIILKDFKGLLKSLKNDVKSYGYTPQTKERLTELEMIVSDLQFAIKHAD